MRHLNRGENYRSGSLWRKAAIGGLAFLMAGCATPIQPTGGPADTTGPTVTETYPKTGTINFDGDYVEFDFSKFVNRGTFQQALSVDPDIGLQYKIDWGHKSVKVKFKNKLPDSTTVIFTLGTNFTDYHGNKMAKPFTLALSTGPTIDKGKIKGKVINAETGKGMKGQTILLYRQPYDLSKRASYIAETDTSGTFEFTYLKKSKYLAFWLEDRNRNKIWDRSIENAQPFDKQYVDLTNDTLGTLGNIYIATIDTVSPSLQGIGVLSTNRLRLRFSENIKMSDSTRIAVTDTLGNPFCEAVPLYIDPKQQYLLYAYAAKALDPKSSYRLHFQDITDDAGNPLLKQKETFNGSSQKDTTSVKIIEIASGKSLYPNEPLKVTYANIIAGTPVADSLKVVVNTKLIAPWPRARAINNQLYVYPDSLWDSNSKYQFRLYQPSTGTSIKDEPKIWSDNSMSGISIVLPDSNALYDVNISNEEYHIKKDTVITKTTDFKGLPPVKYVVRVYKDVNRNGKWDRGKVEPFVAPEPYFIQKGVPVKSGMISELDIKFESGSQ